jgi:hypothetical protein
MSTLNRDFGAEADDKEAFIQAHIAHHLLWYVPASDRETAREHIRMALESDPELIEWAPWPAIQAKGRWLAARKG